MLLAPDLKIIITANRCLSIWDKFYECTDYIWEVLDFEDSALQKASKVGTKRGRGSVRKFMKSMKAKKMLQTQKFSN